MVNLIHKQHIFELQNLLNIDQNRLFGSKQKRTSPRLLDYRLNTLIDLHGRTREML